MAGMSSHGGGHGGHGFNEGDGGDSGQRLPPAFNPHRLARSPYIGFQYPPAFDAGRGHNFPLIDTATLGLFTVLGDENGNAREEDDCVWCRGRDPETGHLLETVPVAKPAYLQRTPWDGYEADGVTPNGRTFIEGDTEYRYKYVDGGAGFRFKEIVASESFADEIPQDITPGYFAGDILTVGKARNSGRSDTRTSSGSPVEFVDVNSAGRRWRDDSSVVSNVVVLNGGIGGWANTCVAAPGSPPRVRGTKLDAEVGSVSALLYDDDVLNGWYDEYIAARRGTYIFVIGEMSPFIPGPEYVSVDWRGIPSESPRLSVYGVRGKFLRIRIQSTANATQVEWITLKAPLLMWRANNFITVVGGETLNIGPGSHGQDRFVDLFDPVPLLDRTDAWKDYLQDWFGENVTELIDETGPYRDGFTIYDVPRRGYCVTRPGGPFGLPNATKAAADFLNEIWASRENQ